MADSIKPVEGNKMGLFLSRFLREMGKSGYKGLPIGADVAKELDPMGFKPASEELEKQAYGSSPFSSPKRDSIGERFPTVRKGRGESLAAVAGLMPTTGAAKAMFLPFKSGALASKNAEMSFDPLMAALRKDPSLLEGSQQKIWGDYGMVEVPRGKYATPKSDDNARFMFEVSDKAAAINPKHANKYGGIHEGEYRLADILHHPELYKIDPELQRMPVSIRNGMPAGTGSFSPMEQAINASGSPGPNGSMKKILLHEAQHAIQNAHGMPQGASPTAMSLNADQTRMLQSIQANPELDQRIRTTAARITGKNDYARYRDVLGEQQSSAVEARADMHPAIAAARSPYFDYANPYTGEQYGTMEYMRQMANKRLREGGGTQPINAGDIQMLLKTLRQTQ